ncbi:hypothetical protein HYT59_01935 [Candidatus Woesebacteria bacterium]|nr:hypothetical protein [Candidatus Woesebacteria bacterium]
MNTTLSEVFSNPIQLINFFQRLTGLLAFSLLFVQLLLGSYMNFWQRYLGAKTFKYHVIEGLVSYGLFLGHPLLYVVFTYRLVGKLTTFILPNLDINTPVYELYLTYGRIGFLLLTIGVVAGLLRNKPFLRAHWRKFHILNYFAFFFVAVHAYNVGTDVRTFPFSFLFWIAIVVITATVFRRFVYPRLKGYLASRQTPETSL